MNKEQGFLLLVLAAAGLASFVIVLPILEFVLMAIILAYVIHPLNARLEPRVGRAMAPFVSILVALLVLILPLIYVGWVVFRDLQDIADSGLGLDIETVEAWLTETTGRRIELAELFEEFGTEAINVLFGDVGAMLSRFVFIAIGLALMVFVLYYLLRDGEEFVAWLIDIIPIHDRVSNRLREQIDKTTYGVIVGHLFVALVEGIAGGLAFWIVGIPNVFFWAFVMALVSLLPIIGPFLIWAPMVGYLVLTGDIFGAVFLFLWGAIVISLIDNWARPIVVDREAHLNPAVILIGVFGGIYAIGATGLFVGPIILGVLVAAMQVFDDEWESLGG